MADSEAMEDGPARPGHGRSPKPRCGAHARSTGQPCKRGAGAGTSHPGTGLCSNHAGSTPTGERNAERIAAEQAVAAFGLQLDGTPAGQILLREIARSSGMVGFLAAQVAAIEPDDLIWGRTGQRITTNPVVPGRGQLPDAVPEVQVEQRARVHPWVIMLRDERMLLAG